MRANLTDELCERLEAVRRFGWYIRARCPFPDHDDRNPSLLVFEDGRFHCLGCEREGWHDELLAVAGKKSTTTYKYVTAIPSLPTDPRQLEVLALAAHDTLLRSAQLRHYLENRGVAAAVEPCELGYWEGFYTFPVRGRRREFLGLVCRTAPSHEITYGTRFTQPSGQSPLPYAPDWIRLRRAERIFVVYGLFDALALAVLTLPVITSTCGKDSFRPEWLADMRKRIVILPDKGEEVTAHKLARSLAWRSLVYKIAYPVGCKDPADVLQKGGPKALIAALNGWAAE